LRDDDITPGFGFTGNVMVPDELSGLSLSGLEDLVGADLRLVDDRVPVGVYLAGLANLVRQRESDLVDDFEALFVVNERPIHERQLELEVEIRRGAETTDDGVRAPGVNVLVGKRSVARGFYVRPLDNRRLDELDTLLGAEQEPFIRAIIYRHDHVTEEIRRP